MEKIVLVLENDSLSYVNAFAYGMMEKDKYWLGEIEILEDIVTEEYGIDMIYKSSFIGSEMISILDKAITISFDNYNRSILVWNDENIDMELGFIFLECLILHWLEQDKFCLFKKDEVEQSKVLTAGKLNCDFELV